MTDAMLAETITISGHNDDEIEAYLARPVSSGPHPSVVVIHHMPGYDRATKEIARTFGVYAYVTLMPNLFHRYAPGAKSADAAAAARAAGGVPDEQCIGDVAGAARYLRSQPSSNGKVGVIGYCSGGRQTVVVACALDIDAAVCCYGGRAPTDLEELRSPLLGLFGADDQSPSPEHTALMEKSLQAEGKQYEFHTYEGAGHAFFSVDRPSYRVDAAKDGWKQIWKFFGEHLAK